MHPFVRLLTLCLALLAGSVQAATVADLFLVRQPVSSQQPSERDEALQRAFDTLVLRLTGNAEAAQSGAVAPLRQEPRQFVRQYGYKGDDLVVEFDPATVERALRDAGVKVWGESRPALLAWWLNDAAEGSQLVGDGHDAAALLRDAAQHRGVALRLPLADLDEQLAATPQALEAKAPGALADLSDRYDADGVLAVHASEAAGGWQASWRLWLDDQHGEGQVKGTNREEVADAVMRAATEFLAPRYAVEPGQASEITLWVEGADLARYAELDRLLQPLGGRLVRLEGSSLVYHLNVRPEQLRSQLALVRLQEVPAADAPAATPGIDVPSTQDATADEPAQQPLVDPASGRTLLHYRW